MRFIVLGMMILMVWLFPSFFLDPWSITFFVIGFLGAALKFFQPQLKCREAEKAEKKIIRPKF